VIKRDIGQHGRCISRNGFAQIVKETRIAAGINKDGFQGMTIRKTVGCERLDNRK
jgi:hypothetical protein